MGDDIQLPASGVKVATDERSIGGATVHVQRVGEIGSAAIDPGRITVGTTGASIAARATRKRIIMLALKTNTGTVDVVDSGSEVGTGFPLEAGSSMTLHTTAAINLDADANNQVIAYVEEYDA